MSIEHGVTPGASKAVSHGVSGHGHGKAKAGDAAGGDFASLLMNLGVQELPQDEDLGGTDVGALAAVAEEAAKPVDAPAGLPDSGDAASNVPTMANAQAGLLADASRPLPVRSPDLLPVPDSVAQIGTDTDRPLARPALHKTAVADASGADVGEVVLPRPDDALPAAENTDAGQASGAQPLLPHVALAQRMAHRMQAAQEAAQTIREQQVQHSEEVGSRLVGQVSERQAQLGVQAQLLVGSSVETGLRPLERRAEKAALRHGGMGEAGTWGVPVMGDAANLNLPAVASTAGLTPEMSVAEQVSYWVSRGTQNAELELDGLGEGPVKVSIAMHGQEARVDFRADQMQTRQMLEGSVSHLRELLQREGLVLSGVSIGSSGSEGAAGRQPQPRPGSRQAVVALAELPSSAAGQGARAATLTGRSVDLFV